MMKKIFIVSFLLLSMWATTAQVVDRNANNYENEQVVDSTIVQKFDYHFSEMTKYINKQDKESAMRELNICKALNPNVAELYYQECMMKEDTEEESEMLLLKALELSPNNELYLQTLAILYYMQQKNDEAVVIRRTLTKLYPDKVEHWYGLFYMLVKNGMTKEALKALDKIEEIEGVTAYCTAQKVTLLAQKKDKKRAIAEWNKLIKHYPSETMLAVDLSEVYFVFNDSASALDNYNKVLAENPNDGYALFKLYEFYQDKDPQKAYDYLMRSLKDRSIAYDSRSTAVRKFVAGLLQAQDYVEIENFLAHLESLYGDEVDVCMLCQQYYLVIENYTKAIEYAQKCIDLQPENEQLWNALATIHIEKTTDEEALYQLSVKASQLFPNSTNWNYYQIIYMFKNERIEETQQLIEYAEKNYDSSENNYKSFIVNLLSGYYWSNGETKRSLELVQKAIDYNPQNAEALNNYAYFLVLCGQRLDDAIKMIEKSVAIKKDDANSLDTYAMVLFLRKEYIIARIYIQRAIQLNGQEATYFEHYGDILYHLGEIEAAVGQWERALQMKNSDEDTDILKEKIKTGTYIAAPLVEIK